jgi:NAD(P)H dehydrogenase (quinone)
MAIVVTGATGHIGGMVARRLADAGVAQRLVVRDPARAPELPGASVAQASYSDAYALEQAFRGADTLLLVSAAESADRVAQHKTAVDAAATAGVQRVVYTSFLNAAPDATFTLARHHWITEQRIRERIPRFTFLRDSLYADFVPLMVGPDGAIRGPAGDGAASVVARADVASVAFAILVDESEQHDGQTYDVTGPAALTMAEMAAEMGAVYVNETVEEAYASRAHYGAPHWQVEGWISTYQAIAAGELATVTDTVQRLTGRPPLTLADLLRQQS